MTIDELLALPPVAPGLFTCSARGLQLLGSRCQACGCVVFPAQGLCPRCSADRMTEQPLRRTGPLWTWTTQGFRPKSPPYTGPGPDEEWTDFGVGYVDLGEVLVEAWLTVHDPAHLRIGMQMRVVPARFGEVLTYAFAPEEAAG